MSSPPIKPVRFYKIGGFKQSEQDPFKGQNLNPFQFGFGNPYPFIFYQPNQRQSITPNSRISDNSLSNTPTNSKTPTNAKTPTNVKTPTQIQKNTKPINSNNNANKQEFKQETIDDAAESQLETIEEENSNILKASNPGTKKEDKPNIEETKNSKEKKPKLSQEKNLKQEDSPKSDQTKAGKEINPKNEDSPKVDQTKPDKEINSKIESNSKSDKTKPSKEINPKIEDRRQELIPKNVDSLENDLKLDSVHDDEDKERENKIQITERFEKIDKNSSDTPRSKDGKLFSIRGTTKTVIEVTTTEIVDESLFATRESSPTKIFKLRTPEGIKPEKSNVNVEIQTDEETKTEEKIIKKEEEEAAPINLQKNEIEKVDKETETDKLEPVIIVDEKIQSNEDKHIVKRKKKKIIEEKIIPIIEQKEEVDEEPIKPTPRSRKDLAEINPPRPNIQTENRTKSLDHSEKNESRLSTRNDHLPIRKRPSLSLDEKKKIEPIKINKDPKLESNSSLNRNVKNHFNLPVIKNMDKNQAKRFEDRNLRFPSLVTEKPAPHRYKLKFRSNESSLSNYDSAYKGYKRCPCLMHRRRFFEKFGYYPDQEHSVFNEYWNDQSDSSILSGRNYVKHSPRIMKSNLDKFFDNYTHQNHQHHHESSNQQRPAWNAAF